MIILRKSKKKYNLLNSDNDFRQGVETLVTSTEKIPSVDHSHLNDQTKLSNVTLGFKPFTESYPVINLSELTL